MSWKSRVKRNRVVSVACAAAVNAMVVSGARAAPPPIRMTPDNQVPACVTPDRLMSFLGARNRRLDPRFRNIARWYEYYGEAWRVRWDYAFYQMAIETNFLSYRAPSGRMGDVSPSQNNFAGIGATGGGVPGDRYPDVKTGVLAQIQHLVAYSGERLAQPVAPRTQLKQDVIIEQSSRLGRPVTFADLARRWAADKHYARSIEWVANQFRSAHCSGYEDRANSGHQPSRRSLPFARPYGLGGPIGRSADESENGARAASPEKPADQEQFILADANGVPFRTIWTRDSETIPSSGGFETTVTTEPAEITGTSDAAEPSANPAGTPTNMSVEPDAMATQPAGLTTISHSPEVEEKIEDSPMMRLGASPGLAAAWASRLLVPNKLPSAPSTLAEAAIGPVASECRIISASYGGQTTVLLQGKVGEQTRLTALGVLEGFESSMVQNYISANAPGSEQIGTFTKKEDALARAKELCPNG